MSSVCVCKIFDPVWIEDHRVALLAKNVLHTKSLDQQQRKAFTDLRIGNWYVTNRKFFEALLEARLSSLVNNSNPHFHSNGFRIVHIDIKKNLVILQN